MQYARRGERHARDVVGGGKAQVVRMVRRAARATVIARGRKRRSSPANTAIAAACVSSAPACRRYWLDYVLLIVVNFLVAHVPSLVDEEADDVEGAPSAVAADGSMRGTVSTGAV